MRERSRPSPENTSVNLDEDFDRASIADFIGA